MVKSEKGLWVLHERKQTYGLGSENQGPVV